jgi:hypothetical protein
VDGSKARHGGDGDKESQREGERKGESRPARTLTLRRNSGSSSRQQRSGEVATASAAEARLRFCEARRWLRGWRDKGTGRRLYRAVEGPRLEGLRRRAGGGRVAAGLGRESEPDSSLRTGPTGGSRLAVRRGRGGDGSGLGWERGSWAS